jgi:hypothetical protein
MLVAGVVMVLASGWPAGAQAGELPLYTALHTRGAPQLDGILDEACWRNAVRTSPFVVIGGAAAEVATQAMVCWDRDHLYVAYVCAEPLMEDIATRLARQKMNPFDESIELFLNAADDRYSYLQLRVDIMGNRDTHRRNDPANELTGQWSAAVSRRQDHWTVELAVPFALLGVSTPKAARQWSWNANRQRMAHGGPVQWTCWSDTRGGFHSPARFGHMIFTDYRAWLRFHFRGQFDAIEQRMGDLVQRYPQVADSFLRRLQQLDQQQVEFFRQVVEGQSEGEQGRRAVLDRGAELVAAYEQALAEMRLVVLREVLR